MGKKRCNRRGKGERFTRKAVVFFMLRRRVLKGKTKRGV